MKKYNAISGFRLPRLEALCDGVIAIALTFLALDIKVPISHLIHSEKDLMNAFFQLSPKLLTYFLSFITLGIYWLAQSTQFYYIENSDRNLNWINLFFLLTTSIMPFTTAFLSEYIQFQFAILVYWFNLSLLGILLGMNWYYAKKHQLVSVVGEEAISVTQNIKYRIFESQILYTVAVLSSFINNYLSIALLVLIQLYYALAVFTKRN